jgi:hypothetical protein
MIRQRTPEQQDDYRKLLDAIWAYANKWTPNRDAEGKGIDTAWTIGLVASFWDALGVPLDTRTIAAFQLTVAELAHAGQTCNCESCQKNRKAAAEREFEEIGRNLNNPSVN